MLRTGQNERKIFAWRMQVPDEMLIANLSSTCMARIQSKRAATQSMTEVL